MKRKSDKAATIKTSRLMHASGTASHRNHVRAVMTNKKTKKTKTKENNIEAATTRTEISSHSNRPNRPNRRDDEQNGECLGLRRSRSMNNNLTVHQTACILAFVLPYLDDGKDWHNVCLTSKMIRHHIHENPFLVFPWSIETNMTRKEVLGDGCRTEVQCSFEPDRRHLIVLQYVVSCPGSINDDYTEVQSGHVVSVYHPKFGLVKKFRLRDNMDKDWLDAGPRDFCNVALSSDGRRIFLQRHSHHNHLLMMSFSEDFETLSLEDFFDNEGGSAYYPDGKNLGVAVSVDGSSFVAVTMKDADKGFTATLMMEHDWENKTMVSTIRPGYQTLNTNIKMCISPDNKGVAMLRDFDIFMNGYGPFGQIVTIFEPHEQRCEVYSRTLGSAAELNGNRDYYDGIGLEYSRDGWFLVGVHTGGAIVWDAHDDYKQQGNIICERKVSAFTFHPIRHDYIILGVEPTEDDPTNIEIWDAEYCCRIKKLVVRRGGKSVADIRHTRISPYESDRVAIVTGDGTLSMHKIMTAENC